MNNRLFECERYCLLDIEIIPEYLVTVFEFLDNSLPMIKTVYRLCVLYEKTGRIKEALEICELGIKLKIDDGTEFGYAGRKMKIEKKIKNEQLLLK